MSVKKELDTVASMPGPTDAAKCLQYEQLDARSAYYGLWAGRADFSSQEQFNAALEPIKAAYQKSARELLALLGETAPCAAIDIDLYEQYLDAGREGYLYEVKPNASYREVKALLED